MNELKTAVSALTFSSFCSRITQTEHGEIEFELKHKFHGNNKAEVFRIQRLDENVVISDMGSTLANLDDVFELSEPDVIKNIVSILRHYNMVKIGGSFIYRLDPAKDIVPQIWHFICGIQFLYAMKIFYT